MKKIFILLGIIFFFLINAQVQAKTILVKALEPFVNNQPPQTYSFETLESVTLKNGHYIESNTIITGLITRVYLPQRGKKDGYFEFIPTAETARGITENISPSSYLGRISWYHPMTKFEKVFKGAKYGIDTAYIGVAEGICFVKGFVKAENGYRFKTATKEVYNNSMVSNIQFGSELNIRRGDILTLKLKKFKN